MPTKRKATTQRTEMARLVAKPNADFTLWSDKCSHLVLCGDPASGDWKATHFAKSCSNET